MQQRIRHTEELEHNTLVLLTLIILCANHNITSVRKEVLHEFWDVFLWRLKKEGVAYTEFYRDIVSEVYRELEDAIWQLREAHFLFSKIPDSTNSIYFDFGNLVVYTFRKETDPRQWEAVEKAVRYLAGRIRRPRKWRYGSRKS